MNRIRRAGEWVVRTRYPSVPIIAGVLLALPSLWVGVQADDWSVRSAVLGIDPVPGVQANPWQPFSFEGNESDYQKLMDHGWLPWWTDPECRIAHLRVLPILTHMLDFRV